MAGSILWLMGAREQFSALPFTPRALPAQLPEVFGLLAQHDVHDAIVYGGALRDAHFGKPVRDFDILVPCDSFLDMLRGHTSRKLRERFESHADRTERVNGSDYHFSYQFGQLELDIFFCPPQMQKHPSAQWKASRGLVGLSCIAMEQASGHVWVDPQFMADAHDRTLTFRQPIAGENPSDPYMQKIQAKYPDHTPVYPFKLNRQPAWV